jgi:hypothetical protein
MLPKESETDEVGPTAPMPLLVKVTGNPELKVTPAS